MSTNMAEEEKAWRQGWAFAYSGIAHLYSDDGELQDNYHHPTIDWMRDSAVTISEKIRARAMASIAGYKP